jgi:sugar-specific transcriptional regulator TrmB
MDNSYEELREEIESQFLNKAQDWQNYLVEVNKSIRKFKPTIDESELYTYDNLCQSVLDAALTITKTASEAGQPMPPADILKEIYKRLIMNKVKDAKIAIKPKFKDN